MTDNKKLEEILTRFADGEYSKHWTDERKTYTKPEAKQALLDWHNKQIEEVIKKPHILPKNAQHMESLKQGINFYHRQMRKRVDKLKERDDE